MIVTTTIPEVNEIMGETFRQKIMVIAETQLHRAPWLHGDEGWQESRLHWAVEAVCAGQVRDTGLAYEVQGDTAVYTIPKGALHRCPCPAAHYGPSQHCKHRVAVEVYRRVAQAYPEEQALPLPPVTVEARLAQTPRQSWMVATPTPQEDRMPADAYIPEPDDAPPVAVQEAPRTTTALTPVDDLEAALQVWTTQRAVVQRFLKQELKPNIDYYTLRIGGKESKPSLSKAGAEKVMGWLKIQASFAPDTGTWEMLGRPSDLVCYVCILRTRSGEIVGEGRGARSLKKDGGDVNKAIKMAEKSACVSAVLRTGCLSDVFTQDLEDQREKEEPATPPTHPSSADLRSRIWALVHAADATITTREACAAYVQRVTGLALEPDQYAAIVAQLEAGSRA